MKLRYKIRIKCLRRFSEYRPIISWIERDILAGLLSFAFPVGCVLNLGLGQTPTIYY